MWERLINLSRQFSKTQIALALTVLALTLGGITYLATSSESGSFGLLYQNLNPKETSEIVAKLDSLHIPCTISDDRQSIYVAKNRVAMTRMILAESGLPADASEGYEIFDKTDVLGSTSFVQNVNLLRALEGELTRTIRTLDNVSNVRVHIVMPKREPFSQDRQRPSASVVIKTIRKRELSPQQVQAIQNLVAAAVPQLECNHVSIVDNHGKLLTRDDSKAEGDILASTLQEAKIAYEDRLSRSVESLLERSLGSGKVRVEVSADLNRHRMTEQSELFDPDSQVARSTQTLSESKTETENAADKKPTNVQTEIPNSGQNSGKDNASSREESQKSEETINYEISKTTRTLVQESGDLKKLSVAVLVDGFYDAQGKYTPRSEEELDKLRALVQTAVGYNKKRGDTIEVINLQFVKEDLLDGDEDGLPFGLTNQDITNIIETLILAILVLLIFFFVIRPALTNYLRQREALQVAAAESVTFEGKDGAEGEIGSDEKIEGNDQIAGGIHRRLFEQVEALVKEDPENASMIIRSWLHK